MLNVLLNNWKVLLVAALFAFLGARIDYLLFRNSARVSVDCPKPIQSSTQLVEQKQSAKHVQDITTTQRVKPDGVTTTTTHTVVTDTIEKTKSNEISSTGVVKSRYQVDVTTNPFEYKNAKIGIGARLGNLPVFGVGEYEIKDNTVRVGLRLEF